MGQINQCLNKIEKLNIPLIMIGKIGFEKYNVLYVSDKMVTLLKGKREDILVSFNEQGFFSFINAEDRTILKRAFRRQNLSDDLELRILDTNKEEILCKTSISFLDNENILLTFTDITAFKEYEKRTKTTYSTIGDSFYDRRKDLFSLFRVNLTKDIIEDIQGNNLYGDDSLAYSYSSLLKIRSSYFLVEKDREKFIDSFSKEKLINLYSHNENSIEQIIYSKRANGKMCYVRIVATLTTHPMTGDIIAFISEEEYSEEIVKQSLLDSILINRVDMIAYITGDEYGVVIGEASKIKKGSIFPFTRNGSYRHYLENQVKPALDATDEVKEKIIEKFYLENIEQKLEEEEYCTINISCNILDKIYYKRFQFFKPDKNAAFYVLLKSDTTDIQMEQIEINNTLKLALEEAKSASNYKSAFLSRMSHEIRTPMNAIIGLDTLALEENVNDEVRDYLTKIGTNAKYLLSLINDILDMSRIESGRMSIASNDFLFMDVINQVNNVIESQCNDKQLKYNVKIDPNIKKYYIGDYTKLEQILINILGNSVKFTNKGGQVTLETKLINEYADNSVIEFILSDTGIGMDKEFIPKIFEAFTQEDNSNTSSFIGSGLGMAITKNLVEMMNGEIHLESNKGKGTTFYVTITLKNSEKNEENKIKEEIQTPISLEGLNILIVDDVTINAEILKKMLSMKKITSVVEHNGKDALDNFKNNDAFFYDAILMDVRMPVMDGLEATRAIRNTNKEDAKTIPIIALTANAFDEDVKRSLNAGMNAHLSKPIEPDILFEVLEDLIRKDKENEQ